MPTKKISQQPLPDRMQVSHLTYAVTEDKEAWLAVCHKEHSDLFGHCDGVNLTVTIGPDQALGQKQDTLMHEALHAMFDLTCFKEQFEDSEKAEEKIIQQLTPHMLMWLRSNPDVLVYLCQTE